MARRGDEWRYTMASAYCALAGHLALDGAKRPQQAGVGDEPRGEWFVLLSVHVDRLDDLVLVKSGISVFEAVLHAVIVVAIEQVGEAGGRVAEDARLVEVEAA